MTAKDKCAWALGWSASHHRTYGWGAAARVYPTLKLYIFHKLVS